MKDLLLNQLLGQASGEADNQKADTIQQPDFQKEAFKYQLELLKTEIDLIDRAISRRETITQTVKNFAVIGWGAAITVFLGQSELRKYVIATAILPAIFWFVDAWWVYLYRGTTFRMRKIQQFINSSGFLECFKQQRFINFSLLDVAGSQYKGTKDLIKHRTFWRIMRFREMLLLYGGLLLFSIVLGAIAILFF